MPGVGFEPTTPSAEIEGMILAGAAAEPDEGAI